MGWIHGLCTRALGGPWVVSTTRWPAYWQGNNHRDEWLGRGCTPIWQRRLWRRVWKRCRPTFPSARTQLHITLIPGPLWTCVWKCSNTWWQGCIKGHGSRTAWTCRGYGWRLIRRNGSIDRGGGWRPGWRRRRSTRQEDTVETKITQGRGLMIP